MKRTSFAIIGGDARFVTLAKLLAADGHAVFPSGHGEEFPTVEGARAANAVILPLPCSVDGININAPLSDTPIEFDDSLIDAIGSKPVFAGMFTRLSKVRSGSFNVFDYGKREDGGAGSAAQKLLCPSAGGKSGPVGDFCSAVPDSFCPAGVEHSAGRRTIDPGHSQCRRCLL